MSALIRPGIWENLILGAKSQWNDKGSYDLVIEAAQTGDAELAAFESNVVSIGMASNMKFYSPNMITIDKKVKSSSDIGEELRQLRYQFMEYGKIFTTPESVEAYIGGTKMFDGLGIPPEEYGKAIAQLTNEPFAKKVHKNLCDKFHALLTAAGAFNGTVMFRQKFLRQSATKNWAVIPRSDISVWIEPMTIPKAQSKIEFTAWEIENGKNDPNPAASTKAANTKEVDVNAGKNLFGGTPAAAAPAIMQAPAGMATPPVLEAQAMPVAQAVPAPQPVATAPVLDAPMTIQQGQALAAAVLPTAQVVPPVAQAAPAMPAPPVMAPPTLPNP